MALGSVHLFHAACYALPQEERSLAEVCEEYVAPPKPPKKSPAEAPKKTPTEVPTKTPAEEPTKTLAEQPKKTPTEELRPPTP